MYEDDVIQSWFLIFVGKNSNSKNFAHMGFCGLKMSTKFWDFAAGMDFDT